MILQYIVGTVELNNSEFVIYSELKNRKCDKGLVPYSSLGYKDLIIKDGIDEYINDKLEILGVMEPGLVKVNVFFIDTTKESNTGLNQELWDSDKYDDAYNELFIANCRGVEYSINVLTRDLYIVDYYTGFEGNIHSDLGIPIIIKDHRRYIDREFINSFDG